MKTIIQANTAKRIEEDIKGIFGQYGVDKGVSEYVVENFADSVSKRAFTSIKKVMPWVESDVEFARVINVIEASAVATMMRASEEHDVSRNAIDQNAVIAVSIDSWKRAVISHRVNNSDKSEKAIRKEFDKQIGTQPAHAVAAFVFNQYMGATGFETSAISESTIEKITAPVIDYMIARGIINIEDTSGKRNGGIKQSHTIDASVISPAIEAAMNIRGDSMMTQVIIGEQFPAVTFEQVTNPKVSIEGKNVVVHNPIADVNTPESMAAVMTAIDKANKVGFVIDRGHIERINAIPDDVWSV